MNVKRERLILSMLVITILITLLGAASAPGIKVYIHIDCAGERVFDKEYDLNFRTVSAAIFLYGCRFDVMAERRYSGDRKAMIRDLNANLYDDLQKVERDNFVPAKDATSYFFDGVFSYTEEGCGSRFNMDKLYSDLLVSLGKDTYLNVEKIAIFPTVTVADLKENTRPLSEFCTVLTGSVNRKKNIALAASKINNVCVMPNEKFSFNEIVGERTEANGFLVAHVIKDGEFVDGVGGGVCQASTTVYNAWLRAGLGVERVSAHSLPVSYVPPSLDAMVSSASDLVLNNDSLYPVYIWAWCENNKMHVSVFGRPCGFEVRTRSVTIKELYADYEISKDGIDWQDNETERIIKRAKNGLISESYRDFYRNGTLVRSEKLRRNEYKPQNGLKAVRTDNFDKNIGDNH